MPFPLYTDSLLKASSRGAACKLEQWRQFQCSPWLQCKICGLPAVPLEDIDDAFEALKAECQEHLLPLLDHLQVNYVHGREVRAHLIPPAFPPDQWNCIERVCQNFPRTTNTCEGYHRHLNIVLSKHHASLYTFLPEMQAEFAEVKWTIFQLALRMSPPSKKPKYAKIDWCLESLVDNYESYKSEGTHGLFQYMLAVGYNLKAELPELPAKDDCQSNSFPHGPPPPHQLNVPLSLSQTPPEQDGRTLSPPPVSVVCFQAKNTIHCFQPPTKAWQRDCMQKGRNQLLQKISTSSWETIWTSISHRYSSWTHPVHHWGWKLLFPKCCSMGGRRRRTCSCKTLHHQINEGGREIIDWSKDGWAGSMGRHRWDTRNSSCFQNPGVHIFPVWRQGCLACTWQCIQDKVLLEPSQPESFWNCALSSVKICYNTYGAIFMVQLVGNATFSRRSWPMVQHTYCAIFIVQLIVNSIEYPSLLSCERTEDLNNDYFSVHSTRRSLSRVFIQVQHILYSKNKMIVDWHL